MRVGTEAVSALVREDPSAEVRRAAIRCLRSILGAHSLSPAALEKAIALRPTIEAAHVDADVTVRSESRVAAVLLAEAHESGGPSRSPLCSLSPMKIWCKPRWLRWMSGPGRSSVLVALAGCLATHGKRDRDVHLRLSIPGHRAAACPAALAVAGPAFGRPAHGGAGADQLAELGCRDAGSGGAEDHRQPDTEAAAEHTQPAGAARRIGSGAGLTRLLAHADASVRERSIATLARQVQGGRITPLPYASSSQC